MTNPPMKEFKVGEPMFVEDMADDDVIVAVNGVTLTKADFDTRIGRYRWFLDRNRGMDVSQKKAMYRAYGRGLVNRFISTEVVAWEARKAGLLDEATVRREVEKSVQLTLEQHNLKREVFEEKVPGGIKDVARTLEDELWCHAYFTNNITVNPEITSELVTNILRQIEGENKVIEGSNAVVRARLAAARKRIVEGGEDFGKVADEVCEDEYMEKNGTGYYGKFGEGTILDENLRKALFSLKKGDTSEILEEDDGYSIYRILDREEAVFEGVSKVDDAKVDLARIWMRKTDLVQPVFSSNPVEDMRQQDFKEQSKRLTKQLRAKAVIVYPHGTNFWKKTQKRNVK